MSADPPDFRRRAIAKAEAEIEHACAEVADQVNSLHHKIAETLDWRQWYRRHTVVVLAAALGVGFILGQRGLVNKVTRRR